MKKAETALRIVGLMLLIAMIVFYDSVTSLVSIPSISLSFILMFGKYSRDESTEYYKAQRQKIITSASMGIKWTQSPILWMVILIAFGGILSLFL